MIYPHRRLRFGVIARAAPTRAAWIALAQDLEAAGVDVLLMPDHVTRDDFSPLVALAAAAQVTTVLRLGTLVAANDFRRPLLLAREALTLDVLSEGRLELGIGAGWNAGDYAGLGVPFDAASTRVARLDEAVGLLTQLLSGSSVSAAGSFYEVREARGLPQPVQRPHPPILIGGGGPHVLKLAALQANIVGLALSVGSDGMPRWSELARASGARRVARIRTQAGSRAPQLELNLLVYAVTVTDDRAAAIAAVARDLELAPEVVDDSPFLLIGTPREIATHIERTAQELGITYFALHHDSFDAFRPALHILKPRTSTATLRSRT